MKRIDSTCGSHAAVIVKHDIELTTSYCSTYECLIVCSLSLVNNASTEAYR